MGSRLLDLHLIAYQIEAKQQGLGLPLVLQSRLQGFVKGRHLSITSAHACQLPNSFCHMIAVGGGRTAT